MGKIIYKEESFKIQGAVFEVYKEMGNGFLESVYQECLEKEFTALKIPFIPQPTLSLVYKSEKLNQIYKPDFICFNKIILELKGVRLINKQHQSQIINYLKATNLKLGYIINFGAYPRVEIKRMVL